MFQHFALKKAKNKAKEVFSFEFGRFGVPHWRLGDLVCIWETPGYSRNKTKYILQIMKCRLQMKTNNWQGIIHVNYNRN